MATDFIFKKRRIFTLVITLSIVFSALLYSFAIKHIKTLPIGHSFYFVVADSTHLEISTILTTQMGGAGYLIETGKGDRVALSVYLSREESEQVCIQLTKTGERVQTVVKEIDALYFLSNKKHITKIKGAFMTLYDIIKVLEMEINRLSNGATQQSSREVLSTIKNQLYYLSRTYKSLFPSYATLCKKAGERLLELDNKIIYVNDLRHLLCWLSDGYVDLAKDFSI